MAKRSRLSRAPAAVIFDLDGVLVDSEPLYTLATQEIVGPYGKTYDWSIKQHMIGRDAREGAAELMKLYQLPLSPEEYLRQRNARLRELFPEVEALSGAEDFVQRLRQHALPLAVATSSDRQQFEIKTRRHAWIREIRVVVCGDDPEVGRAKPAPDLFLAAARRLQILPEACLVVEDAPAGVQAARAAGMMVVAIPDRHVSADLFPEADLIVRSYAELSSDVLGFVAA